MEFESTISKLNEYRSSIDENLLDDFIDFLYSRRIINENDYYVVYNEKKTIKLHGILKIIASKDNETLKPVFEYLNEVFPNVDKVSQEEQRFRISSVQGGFPKLPPNYVTRKTLVEDVKSKLLDLKWNQKLIVHGMVGYGKSCLVNEVLNDLSIRECFNNHLFWINLGEHRSKKTVLQPLWRLYTTASRIIESKLAPCPDDVQILKDLLTDLFLKSRLKNALIILDDACSDEVLTYFDIKCKTVITTQNKKILREEEGIFVEVKTGFSRNESLELFKKSLEIEHDLPAAAEEIHYICKGHPMLIALIGSYLKDNVEAVRNNSNEIWQYMKEMFSSGKYSLNEYDDHADVPKEKIRKCIEQLLANGLKELYQDLAIFTSDVNIPPEVLKILWDKSSDEVRNIMNKLAEKSLIVPFYHKSLRTYIYGIHDIYLSYLKNVTQNRIVSLHKKLISGYDKTTKGNYALLPNDNYTLQFIGYHLFNAEAFQKFNIYFDLKFLEAKIRAVGKEDVLRDMEKYGIYITRNENMLNEKLQQYMDFIGRCGNILYNYEKTDIIQFALAEKKDSMIYKEALLLAQTSSNLYFQLQQPIDEYDYSVINVKEDITYACYVDSAHHILIGTASGKIKLFFEEYEKEISSFVGHNGAIKKLLVSPDKRYFLSVSEDRTVMLWKFAAGSARNSRDFSNFLPVSPKAKQKHWQDLHTSDKGQEKPNRIFQLSEKDDYLMSAAFCNQFPVIFRIITGTNRGNVIVWDAETGNQIFKTGHRGHSIPSVIYLYTESSDKVIFACDDNIVIYKFREKTAYDTLFNKDNCSSLFFADDKIIAVSEKNITLWENYKPYEAFKKIDAKKYNVCSTLTDDCNYLVVSTNLNTIYIWDVEEKTVVREFKSKGLTKSLDTFYDEDKSFHILLIGSDQRTLQQRYILPGDKKPNISREITFLPHWKKKHALIALVNSNNQIQVFNGSTQISETDAIESKVTCTCFDAYGQNVIYGLENGQIHLFNLRSKKNKCIKNDSSHGPVTYLRCFNPNDTRTHSISSCGSGDSLDLNISYEGIIISVFSNNAIIVYNESETFIKEVNKPLIFFNVYKLVLVDNTCQIFVWNVNTGKFSVLNNNNNNSIFQPANLSTAAYCIEKSLLAVVYKENDKYFLNVYNLLLKSNTILLVKQIKIPSEAISSCFSCDGSLLAVGMTSGDIMVWNLNQKFLHVTLTLHDCRVEELLFSPTSEPILVSLGEYPAWWNLKPFQKLSRKRGRPNSIDILDNVAANMSSMDISFWADRKCVDGTDYLLSCMKLHDRARYISASKDFNSFLTVDDKGKIYVMEIVPSNTDQVNNI